MPEKLRRKGRAHLDRRPWNAFLLGLSKSLNIYYSPNTKPMILFLYGEDNYRSSQKLKALKEKFVEKYSDINLSIYEDSFEFGQIREAVTALPFLSDKRLIIIKNLFKTKNKNILDNIVQILDYIPEETILIFWEDSVPDKRTVLFKRLTKEKAEEFEKLQGIKLNKWIQEKVNEKGGNISSKDAEKLAFLVGEDLWQMESEIGKLAAYKKRGEISAADVDLLVKARLSGNIFGLVDAIGGRDYKKAARIFHELLNSGENEIYILTMIIRQFRNLIIIKDLSKKSDRFGIAKEAGLHPFVVQKALLQSKNFEINELKDIYERLAGVDSAIKTGEREPILALDLLLKNLCR